MSDVAKFQINRVKINSFLLWFKSGFLVLKRHFLKTALIAVILLAFFAGFLFLGKLFANNYIAILLVTVGLSLVFPVLLGAEAASYYYLIEENQVWSLKKIFATFKQWNIIRLIIVYLLLTLLISLGGQFLTIKNEELVPIVNLVVDILLLGLQMVFFIALPTNIRFGAVIPPFRSLALGIKAIGYNFIPALAFILIMIMLLLAAVFIALPLSKIIGIYALTIYAAEVVLFLMFLGLCTAAMAKDLVSIKN